MKTLMLIPLIAVLAGCNSGGSNTHASEPKQCSDYATIVWDNNSFSAVTNYCNDILSGSFSSSNRNELTSVTIAFWLDTIQSYYIDGVFDYAIYTNLYGDTFNIYWSDNKQCYGPKDNDVIVCDLSYDLDYTDTLARVNNVLGL